MLVVKKSILARFLLAGLIFFLQIQGLLSADLQELSFMKKLDSYGLCSKIAIANHPTFEGKNVPFYIFTDSKNDSNVLKECQDGSGNASPISTDGRFEGVVDMTVSIDDFGGTPIFKWAVSSAHRDKLIDGTPIIPTVLLKFPGYDYSELSVESATYGQASYRRVFVKTNKILSLNPSLWASAGDSRWIMSYPLNVNPVDNTKIGVDPKTLWVDEGDISNLQYSALSEWDPNGGASFSANGMNFKNYRLGDALDPKFKGTPLNSWTDVAAGFSGGSNDAYFMAGKPIIYGGDLLAWNIKCGRPFNSMSEIMTRYPFQCWSSTCFRWAKSGAEFNNSTLNDCNYITQHYGLYGHYNDINASVTDRRTPPRFDKRLARQYQVRGAWSHRFDWGRREPAMIRTFAGEIYDACTYDSGAFTTNMADRGFCLMADYPENSPTKRVFVFPVRTLSEAFFQGAIFFNNESKYMFAPDHDFSRAVKISAGKKDLNTFYLAALRDDGRFEVARATNFRQANQVIEFALSSFRVSDLSVDNNGRLALVDQPGNVWWASIDDIIANKAAFEAPPANTAQASMDAALLAEKQAYAVAAQKSQIIGMQSELDQIRADLQKLSATYGGTDSQSLEERLKTVRAAMQIALEAAQKDAQAQLLIQNDLLTQVGAATEAGKALATNIANLKTEISTLQASNKKLTDDIAADVTRADSMAAAIQSTLSSMGIDASATKLDLSISPTEFAAKMADLQNKLAIAAKSKNDAIAALQKTNDSLTAQKKDLQAKLAALQSTATANPQLISDLENEINNDLPAQLATLQAQIQSRDAAIAAQQQQINSLTTAGNAYSAEIDRIKGLLAGGEVTADMKSVLEDSKTALFQKVQSILTLKQARIDSLTAELKSLQAAAAEPQRLNDLIKAATSEHKALMDQKQTLIDEQDQINKALLAQIDATQAQLQTVVQNNLDMAVENQREQQLNTDIATAKAALDKAQKDKEALQDDISAFNTDLKAFLSGAKVSADFSGSLTEILNASLQSLQNLVTSRQVTLDAKKALFATMQAEKDAAMKELDAFLKTDYTKDPSAKDKTLQTRILEFSSMMEQQVSDAKKSAAEEKDSLEKELLKLKQDISDQADYKTQIAQLQAKVDQKNQEIKDQEASYAKLIAEKQVLLDAAVAKENALKDRLSQILGSDKFKTQAGAAQLAESASLAQQIQFIFQIKDATISSLKKDIESNQAASNSLDKYADELNKNQQTINLLSQTEDAVKTQLTTLLQNSVTGAQLTEAQAKLITSSDAKLEDILPVLTALSAAKDKVIASLKTQITDTNAQAEALKAINAQAQAAFDQKQKDLAVYKSFEEKLSQYASEQIDGAFGTLQFFSKTATMEQKMNQLMAFRKAQMQEMQLNFERERAALNADLFAKRVELEQANQKLVGLKVLTDEQAKAIETMKTQNAELERQLAAKDVILQNTKNELQVLTQRMQEQINDLKNKRAALEGQISAKEQEIKNQNLAIEEKNRIIKEKELLSSQYAAALKDEQDKAAQLADDLNKQRAMIISVQDVIDAKAAEYQNMLGVNESLRQTKANLLADKKAIEDAYAAHIDKLVEMNKLSQARIDQLQKNEEDLTKQVDVLSGIVLERIGFDNLSVDEQQQLQAAMGDQGPLFQKLVKKEVKPEDIAPFQISWYAQELQNVVTANPNVAFPAETLATVSRLASVYKSILLLGSTGKTPSSDYQQLSSDAQASILSEIPDFVTKISSLQGSVENQANPGLDAFRADIHSQILAKINTAAKGAVDSWNLPTTTSSTGDQIQNTQKSLLQKILLGDENTLQVGILKVRLNGILEAKKAEIAQKKKLHDQQVASMEQAVEATKEQLAEQLAKGEADMAAAAKKFKALEEQKNQLIEEQKQLTSKLGLALEEGAEAARKASIQMMQRQSGEATAAKNLDFFQTKKSEVNAAIQAMRASLAEGVGNVSVFDQMVKDEALLNRNMAYSTFVLPLALKYDANGNLIRYFKTVDRTGAPVETGKEELGNPSSIAISYLDAKQGTVGYLDKSSFVDGRLFFSGTNRFMDNVKIQAVNRGYNRVSFEVPLADKRLILTLVPTTAPFDLPAGVAPKGNQNYEVKWLALNNPATVADEQMFYAEGLERPVYGESIILRAHSSANNYANDTHGYLSIKETAPGKSEFIYKPYISEAFHSSPGNKETLFGIHQFDANSGTEEAFSVDLMSKLSSFDTRTVVDAASGFTAYDKALADYIAGQADLLTKIYNKPRRFEDFVLNVAEFFDYRNKNQSLTTKDLKQLQDFAQKVLKYVVTSGSTSNLSTTSAGYKALFGEIDAKGKVVGKAGLVTTEKVVEKANFANGDYVVLATREDLVIHIAADSVQTEKPVVLAADNHMNNKVNFRLEKDSASNKFRILSHPALGDFKLSVSDGTIGFVAKNSASGEDLFLLDGDIENIKISTATGFISAVKDDASGVSSLKFTKQDSNQSAEQYKFKGSLAPAGSFKMQLIDMSGAMQNAAGVSIETLALQTLQKDQTQANQIITDLGNYLRLFVTDEIRDAIRPKVQTFVLSVMNNKDLAKTVSQSLLNDLEASLSLFDLSEASFFQIKDKDGAVLKAGEVYVSDEQIEVDGQVSAKKYFDFKFEQTTSLDKGTMFKVVPNPNRYGSFLIIAYLAEFATPVYLQVSKLNLISAKGTPSFASVVTGSSAMQFDRNKEVSEKDTEFFEISGATGAVKIRSLSSSAGFAADEGFLVSKAVDGVKKLCSVDASTKQPFKINAEASVFSMVKFTDYEVAMLSSTTEMIPAKMYELLVNIYNNKDLADADKTKKVGDVFEAFKRLVCEIDANNKLVIKQYFLDRNFSKITTDAAKGIMSMADVMQYIQDYIIFNPQRGFGVKLSPAAQVIVDGLNQLYLFKSPFAITPENIKRVLSPGDIDIAVSLSNYQTDYPRIKPMLADLIGFLIGHSVSFVNDASLDIQDFDSMILRTDMDDGVKQQFFQKIQLLLGSQVISDNTLKVLLAKTLTKINPDAAVFGLGILPTRYQDMAVYDRFDLVENMVSGGRYRPLLGTEPFTGEFVVRKNIDEARKILQLTTDDEINKSPFAPILRKWSKKLKIKTKDKNATRATVARTVIATPSEFSFDSSGMQAPAPSIGFEATADPNAPAGSDSLVFSASGL